MTHAANRIVELQLAMNTGAGDLYSLHREQRELWDRHYPDASYDRIVDDVWAYRTAPQSTPATRPLRRGLRPA